MQISCPQCGKMLEAPFPLPSMAQCPFCAAVFSPVSPPPPVPQPPTIGQVSPVLPATAAYPSSPAIDAVRGPAIAILVAGGLNLLWAMIDLAYRVFLFMSIQKGQALPLLPPPFQNVVLEQSHVIGGAVFDLIWTISGIVMIYGALKMQRLESYGLAVSSSIMSLIPCVTCCCCLGVPFGLWALVVLNRPEVRSSFR